MDSTAVALGSSLVWKLLPGENAAFLTLYSWLSQTAVIFSGHLAGHHRLLTVTWSQNSHGVLGWEPVSGQQGLLMFVYGQVS